MQDKRIIFLIILIILFPAVANATDYSADVNCMGYFAMEDDGNETDRSATYDNTMTEASGDIPQSTDKKFGNYSRDFEAGDTEYLIHGDNLSTDINGANQAISIVGFFKAESQTDWMALVVKGYPELSRLQYLVMFNDIDQLYFNLSSDGAANSSATGATDIIDGNWHGFAGVYDDTDIRMYIDGSLDSNGADNPKVYSGGIFASSSSFLIGATHWYPGNYYDGLADDMAIFNRALTSVEVSDINTNGVAGTTGAATTLYAGTFYNATIY